MPNRHILSHDMFRNAVTARRTLTGEPYNTAVLNTQTHGTALPDAHTGHQVLLEANILEVLVDGGYLDAIAYVTPDSRRLTLIFTRHSPAVEILEQLLPYGSAGPNGIPGTRARADRKYVVLTRGPATVRLAAPGLTQYVKREIETDTHHPAHPDTLLTGDELTELSTWTAELAPAAHGRYSQALRRVHAVRARLSDDVIVDDLDDEIIDMFTELGIAELPEVVLQFPRLETAPFRPFTHDSTGDPVPAGPMWRFPRRIALEGLPAHDPGPNATGWVGVARTGDPIIYSAVVSPQDETDGGLPFGAYAWPALAWLTHLAAETAPLSFTSFLTLAGLPGTDRRYGKSLGMLARFAGTRLHLSEQRGNVRSQMQAEVARRHIINWASSRVEALDLGRLFADLVTADMIDVPATWVTAVLGANQRTQLLIWLYAHTNLEPVVYDWEQLYARFSEPRQPDPDQATMTAFQATFVAALHATRGQVPGLRFTIDLTELRVNP
jgi:hypothetical protein